MIPALIALALALHLILTVSEGAVPPLRRILPLGGSHTCQVGILLGGTFGGWELFSAIQSIAQVIMGG